MVAEISGARVKSLDRGSNVEGLPIRLFIMNKYKVQYSLGTQFPSEGITHVPRACSGRDHKVVPNPKPNQYPPLLAKTLS